MLGTPWQSDSLTVPYCLMPMPVTLPGARLCHTISSLVKDGQDGVCLLHDVAAVEAKPGGRCGRCSLDLCILKCQTAVQVLIAECTVCERGGSFCFVLFCLCCCPTCVTQGRQGKCEYYSSRPHSLNLACSAFGSYGTSTRYCHGPASV